MKMKMIKARDIGHGFMISAADARRLAGGRLPRPGYEKKVIIENRDFWLFPTLHRGELVWAIREVLRDTWKAMREGIPDLPPPFKENPNIDDIVVARMFGRKAADAANAGDKGSANYYRDSFWKWKQLFPHDVAASFEAEYAVAYKKNRTAGEIL